MPTTALYQWSVAGSPVDVLIDLQVVDRLRLASVASEVEIGGVLLGHFDGRYTVITDFEVVESEHRRGAAFTLSSRDEQRLGARVEARRKKGDAAVGFFRSHQRSGLYLDEGDNHVLASFFNNPNQVGLLVKPTGDRAAMGGFFFWEDGEINRKQTYLQFPMSARELELGDFPLVEPVQPIRADIPTRSAAAATATMHGFQDDFETVDHVPIPPRPESVTHMVGETADQYVGTLPPPPARPAVVAERTKSRISGPVIGIIAAAAAIGGYVIGTSGSNKDRFGARAGDISLNSSPPEPDLAATAAVKPSPVSGSPASIAAGETTNAPSGTTSATPAVPPTGTTSVVPDASAGKVSPMPPATAAPPPKAAKATRLPDSIPPATAPETQPEQAAAPAPTATDPTNTDASNWQHFHQQPPADPALTARANVPAATPVPRSNLTQPVAESSVFLETVESGKVSRAMAKLPVVSVFHHPKGGQNYVPPQAVHSFSPRVPRDLAKELTGSLPVDLKLTVNEEGRVSTVELLSRQTPDEFVRLAGDAAYEWKFEPARVKDKPVTSDVIAHFRFRPAL